MPASRTLATFLVLMTTLAAANAAAQQVESGARVRGRAAAGPFDGRVAWASTDSLAVTQQGDTRAYSRADIRRLDVATGSRRNLLKGTAIGAGVGAAAGIAIIIAADDDQDSELEGLEVAVAGAMFLGSTALGGIVGALIKSPRWTRVHPTGLGVSISF